MLKPQKLKNGIQLLKLPRISKTFTIGFIVNAGYSYEKNYKFGISKLTERLFWCGTDKHSDTSQLYRELDSIGGSYHSSTNHEFTSFYVTVPNKNQYKAISLLAEVIQRSHFDEKDILMQKNSLIKEISGGHMQGDFYGSPLSLGNLYKHHDYGTLGLSSIEKVNAINSKDLQEFIQRQYRPDNCTIVVSGDFQVREITENINQHWSYWNPTIQDAYKIRRFRVEEIKENLPSLSYIQQGYSHINMVFGFILDEGLEPRIIRETSPEARSNLDIVSIRQKILYEYATKEILNSILSGGKSSRLYYNQVVQKGLYFNIESNFINFSQSSFLEIDTQVSSQNLIQGFESVLADLYDLKKKAPNITEMIRAKEYLKGLFIRTSENNTMSTIWEVENYMMSGLEIEIDQLLEIIDKTDANEVRKYAENLFQSNRFYFTTLGTAKESRVIDKLIEKYLS